MKTLATTLVVRVIAKDGKFLGDDIGGALVTIRDVRSGELLASGKTAGTSGAAAVMCGARRRGEPIPTANQASLFTAKLDLAGPRLIEVTAFGPLAAQGSANTVSATQWIVPGRNIDQGDGFLLELPGLVVQIVDPPTHYMPATLSELRIRANVTMMCGCPIGSRKAICDHDPQPWQPGEFEVIALFESGGKSAGEQKLAFDTQSSAPSQFHAAWKPPAPGVFEMTVYAWQASTGNTGVDRATFIVP